MCVFYYYQKGLAPEILEDLYHVIKKTVSIRKHLERNRRTRLQVQVDS
uniref:Ribosomal protein S13 n=1 Tax=Cucumis melo TaxID=3656 RepID=A0A9I9E201_CUCME